MKKVSVPNLNISVKDIKTWLESIDRKTLIQNATIVSAFLVFILFFFLPIFFYNRKISEDVKLLREKVNQASTKIAKIPEMTKQKEMFGEQIKQVRGQFFEIEEADRLIEIVSTIAADSGVRISASRPSVKSLEFPAPFSTMYVTISYELAVEGPYHNLGTFINRLEHHSRNLSVHVLDITSGEKVMTTHQATFVLTAFLKRPKA